jgi:hypothetical protein
VAPELAARELSPLKVLGVAADQRTFKAGDCLFDFAIVTVPEPTPKNLAELGLIGWIGGKFRNTCIVFFVHLHGISDWISGLILQTSRPPVPELKREDKGRSLPSARCA